MRRTTIATAVAATSLSLVLAGCGADSKDASSDSGTVPTVTVALSAISAFWADLLVAEENGYFNDAGVTVDVKILGGTVAPTEVSAGRMDLTVSGATGSFSPALKGHDTKVIYQMIPNSAFKQIIVSGKSPATSLADLSGKRIGVVGVGTATYGTALAFSNYVAESGGSKPTLVPVSDKASEVAQLVSGTIDASVGKLDDFHGDLAAGKVRVLSIDQATLDKVSPAGVVGSVYWGLKENLNDKKDAITKMVAGLRRADGWLDAHSEAEIAAVLVKSPLIPSASRSAMAGQVKYDKPLYSETDGSISAQDWQMSLDAYSTWGLPNIDVKSPILSYDQHVDMSYWNDAGKLTGSASK
jgi:ABC-type nitrate/sulfonate/bicarbonate transport system substrate-binding protein